MRNVNPPLTNTNSSFLTKRLFKEVGYLNTQLYFFWVILSFSFKRMEDKFQKDSVRKIDLARSRCQPYIFCCVFQWCLCFKMKKKNLIPIWLNQMYCATFKIYRLPSWFETTLLIVNLLQFFGVLQNSCNISLKFSERVRRMMVNAWG